jgi:uncharacterized protein involved in exopolysaccharide biosynthesis
MWLQLLMPMDFRDWRKQVAAQGPKIRTMNALRREAAFQTTLYEKYLTISKSSRRTITEIKSASSANLELAQLLGTVIS